MTMMTQPHDVDLVEYDEDDDIAHMMTKQKNIPWVSCKLAWCVKSVYWTRLATTYSQDDLMKCYLMKRYVMKLWQNYKVCTDGLIGQKCNHPWRDVYFEDEGMRELQMRAMLEQFLFSTSEFQMRRSRILTDASLKKQKNKDII